MNIVSVLTVCKCCTHSVCRWCDVSPSRIQCCSCCLDIINGKLRSAWESMTYGLSSREKFSTEYWSPLQAAGLVFPQTPLLGWSQITSWLWFTVLLRWMTLYRLTCKQCGEVYYCCPAMTGVCVHSYLMTVTSIIFRLQYFDFTPLFSWRTQWRSSLQIWVWQKLFWRLFSFKLWRGFQKMCPTAHDHRWRSKHWLTSS